MIGKQHVFRAFEAIRAGAVIGTSSAVRNQR
jgi:hypothetical protein